MIVFTNFLTGTLANTPIWEYLLFNWIVTGVMELVVGVYIVLYMAPKGVDKMVAQGIKEAKNSAELAPIVDKGKEIIEVLEPLIKQIATLMKNLDLEKTQKDFEPLMTALKNVKPEDVEATLQSIRDLTGSVKNALEKPKMALPEPTSE